MNIVLTGATSPIGKMLYDHYKVIYNVTPISRLYGWDLYKEEQQDRLVQLTNSADVFLNIAHLGFVQSFLLERSKAKINISFGSLITKFSWNQMKYYGTHEYIAHKLFLEYVHSSIKNSAIINVSKFGQGSNNIPEVEADQIIYAVNDIITRRAFLPKVYEITNGGVPGLERV